MKTAIRSLFVWLLLLALPLQGMAAARMLPCVGAVQAGAVPAMQAHAAPCARHAAAIPHAAGMADHGGTAAQHSHGGNGCGFCCIGVALAPALVLPLALAPPDFIAIPFRAGHVTSADPALPERPPRPLSA